MGAPYSIKMNKNLKILNSIESLTSNLPEPMVQTIIKKFPENRPFFVLFSCILSLRAKDSVTLPISIKLFKKYNTLEKLAYAKIENLEKIIKPIGFFRQKAATIKNIAINILEKHHGVIPSNYQELTLIKGIGPKTANLVLSEAFDIPAICVDTHVHRLSNHLKIVDTKTAEETQEELEKIYPKKYWKKINKLFVTWGQFGCKPNSKKCKCYIINENIKKVDNV